MKKRAWQKIWTHGNSACISLPRPLMFLLDVVPGDLIVVEQIGDEAALRVTKLDTDSLDRKSPGMIREAAPVVPA